MAVVSCDSGIQQAGVDEDGLVTVNISTGEAAGNSRSLTTALAKTEANYVEVIFEIKVEDSTPGPTVTKYYRAEGYNGTDLKIKIPAGIYPSTTTVSNLTTTNTALILIGRKSDKTLLATGVISTPVTVTTGTTITFTVTALKIDTSPSASSSFNIDETSGTTRIDTVAGWVGETKSGLYGEEALCFQVPFSTTGITGQLTIDGLGTTGAYINVVDGTTFSPAVTPVTFKQNYGTTSAITATLVTPSGITTTVPKPIGTAATNQIEFTFASGGNYAEYTIIFDIPVVGFSKATGSGSVAREWHIRGGTDEGQPDFSEGSLDDANEGVGIIVTNDPVPKHKVIIKPTSPASWL